MGHYLSLPHPFLGWEGGITSNDTMVWNFNEPAPEYITYNYTFFQDTLILDTMIVDTIMVEKVDRSNCNEAADGFCDTEADYLAVRWNCTEEGISDQKQTDPNGEIFYSNGDLIMSYASDNCSYRFSGEQILAMRASAEEQKADIVLFERPSDPMIEDELVYLNQPFDQDFDRFDVSFDWEPVTGADYYLFQLGIEPSLSLVYLDTLVRNPELFVEELPTNFSQLYWKIIAIDEVDLCNQKESEILPFEPTDVSSISSLDANQITVSPNISEAGNSLYINGQNTDGSAYKIYSSNGQIQRTGTVLGSSIDLDASLNPGVYFLQIGTSKQHYKTLKFIII